MKSRSVAVGAAALLHRTQGVLSQATTCDGGINLCIALDHSGSVCSHSLPASALSDPDPNGGERDCRGCPAGGGSACLDTCRNGTTGVFSPCPFEGATGYDRSTCCHLFRRLVDLAVGVVDEVDEHGGGSEYSIVGFGTSAFYQTVGPSGAIETEFDNYPGMTDADGARAILAATDYQGGATNHGEAIRYW